MYVPAVLVLGTFKKLSIKIVTIVSSLAKDEFIASGKTMLKVIPKSPPVLNKKY